MGGSIFHHTTTGLRLTVETAEVSASGKGQQTAEWEWNVIVSGQTENCCVIVRVDGDAKLSVYNEHIVRQGPRPVPCVHGN